MNGILGWLIIGGVAGWLAGKLMKGGGFGVLVNILLGIAGSLASATVGAIALLVLVSLFKK